jgi:hypothetical protein
MAWQERELKFMLDEARTPELLAAAAAAGLEIETHDPAMPVAYSRTTYLDTDDHALLLADDGIRRRLRIREYADAPDLGAAPVLSGVSFLELKESQDGQRRKARIRIDAALLRQLFDGAATASGTFGQLGDPRVLACGERLRPRMTTWYRRTSLVSPGLRVTLDHGVVFCAPTVPGQAGAPATPGEVLSSWPGTVLELKLDGELPTWLARQVAGIPEAVGLSKFEAGMSALMASRLQAA